MVACHKRSHFNLRVFTFDFSWNCCTLLEAKKFPRNPGQIKWVTRETRYHVSIAELLKRNLMCQVAELFQIHWTMLKILYFSGDHQVFQKLPTIKFLYSHGRKHFSFIGWESIIWDRGYTFSKILNSGRHISLGYLDRLL